MGVGFAQILALNGIPTAVADADAARGTAGRERALQLAERFEANGLLPAHSVEFLAERVVAAPSVGAAVEGADFVLEAVAEDVDVKHAVFAAIEDAASTETVLATNTSAIPIRDLSAPLRHPERFLGTHWFNPPQWVPCVEVIAGPRTDPGRLDAVHGLLLRVGKSPVRVGDSAGFVANRIQFAMFKEAAAVVQDGVATPEEVDTVVRTSFGFRLPFFGPFMIADMAGLDVYEGAYRALTAGLGSRFVVPGSVRDLLERGRLGAKTGGGYFSIAPDRLPELIEQRDAAYVALSKLLASLSLPDAPPSPDRT